MPEIFAFIQARTSSTRLPGKILKTIPKNSRDTILDHIFSRLCKLLPKEKIIFLIPENDFDALSYLQSITKNIFLGSEENVLDRYVKCAIQYQADFILRCTGDNPFIDIEHAELLLEGAMNHPNPPDLISFDHLPIGMGVELVKTTALINIQEKLTKDHHEHVTLHIKENPSHYKFIKLSPVFDEKLFTLYKNLRLTIDTWEDYEFANDVFLKLSPIDSFFGARIVSENIEKFSSPQNNNIEQISFNIKPFKKEKSVQILYADPILHGQGHWERCKILYTKIQAMGINSEMTSNTKSLRPETVKIIDSRDIDVWPISNPENTLLIDNMNPVNEGYHKSFSLPHPKINLSFVESLKNLLLPWYIDHFRKEKSEQNYILIYTGFTHQYPIEQIEISIHRYFQNIKIFVIGHKEYMSKNIEYIPNCSKFTFLTLLAGCKFFLTHFGQSMMEAYYIGKKVIQFPITPYHKYLSEYLFQETNIPILNDSNMDWFSFHEKMNHIQFFPSENTGFKSITKEIINLCKK